MGLGLGCALAAALTLAASLGGGATSLNVTASFALGYVAAAASVGSAAPAGP